jgi:hypothetical protein
MEKVFKYTTSSKQLDIQLLCELLMMCYQISEVPCIEQSLYYRRKHRYGKIEYIELCVESVYLKRWEGPYYRELPIAMVKAGPKGLRPEFGLL